MKNPPSWLWYIIGVGFLILGISGIYKYGISQKYAFYIGYIVIGVANLLLALIKSKTK